MDVGFYWNGWRTSFSMGTRRGKRGMTTMKHRLLQGVVLAVCCCAVLVPLADARDIQDAAGEFGSLQAQLIVIGVTSAITIIVVLIHYEALVGLAALMNWLKIVPRARVVLLILGLLIAHQVEVWIYAVGYYFLVHQGEFGYLAGEISESMIDYAYFSLVNFSTLGYGDILPHGPVRLLTAMESLTGLVLITWSASFTFLEMQRFWK